MSHRPPRGPRGHFNDRPRSNRTDPSEFSPSDTPEDVRRTRTPEIRIAGNQAVRAVFRQDPARVLCLFYTESRAHELGEPCQALAQRRLPYRMVPESELERIYGSPHHGGVVAITKPKTELSLTPKALAHLKTLAPVHFVLDGIGNPHNIGAIARSLAFFGFKSLILSEDPRQAGLSDAAFRVAEGGLEVLEIYRAKGLQDWIAQTRPYFRITGTALSAQGQSLESFTQGSTPRLILLGNEEVGLSPQRLQQCDDLLMIPGSGALQSLNVAQTAAILGYAFQSTFRLPKLPAGADQHPRPLRAERKGGGRRPEESKGIPKVPDSKDASRKKPHSPKGSRPGTKNPSS